MHWCWWNGKPRGYSVEQKEIDLGASIKKIDYFYRNYKCLICGKEWTSSFEDFKATSTNFKSH